MTRQVILNADDFGMSSGTVDGIVRCAEAGVISSTTVMATGEAFDYGISRLPKLGRISVGVHLNATEGRALSAFSEAPTLVDEETGRFRDPRNPDNLKALRPEHLYAEFDRQIRRVLDTGIGISHLDNHHNWIYFSEPHFTVVAKLARQYQIPIRFPLASFSRERTIALARGMAITEESIGHAAESGKKALRENGIRYPDYFWYEFTSVSRTMAALQELLRQLPDGVSEICVHPGLDTKRQKEEFEILHALTHQGILDCGIELVPFSVVSSKSGGNA